MFSLGKVSSEIHLGSVRIAATHRAQNETRLPVVQDPHFDNSEIHNIWDPARYVSGSETWSPQESIWTAMDTQLDTTVSRGSGGLVRGPGGPELCP